MHFLIDHFLKNKS